MNSLINLRHLYARSDIIAQIYGIGNLTKLQELHEFHVKKEDGHRITELRNLNDIRGFLRISNLEAVIDRGEAIGANIIDKVRLKALELKWLDNLISLGASALAPDLTTGVPGGSAAPRNLQEVKLFGYPGNVLPNLVVLLKHVRVIEISSCSVLHVLPPLEQLEHLQKHKLHKLPSIKDINFKVYGSSDVVFQSLEELSIEHMEKWESWTCAGGREFISNLRKLRIFGCHKLREVPFESLGTGTEEIFLEIFLEQCGPHANAISSYLQRLTGLNRLEIQNSSGNRSSGILTIPCEQFTCLEYLTMKGFREVQMKGGLWHLKNLRDLRIFDCCPRLDEGKHILTRVPTQGAHVMHSLTHLTLSGRSLSKDLGSIFLCKIPSLRTLCFEHTWNFPSFTGQWLQQLSSLEEMSIYWCNILPSSLGILSSLKKLTIKTGMSNYMIPPNSMPRNLKELQIESPHLELEDRFQNPKCEFWPQEQNMVECQRGKESSGERKLSEVQQSREEQSMRMKKVGTGSFNETSTLKPAKEVLRQGSEAEALAFLKEEQSSKLGGMDWPNIAHVPYIRINRNIIQNLYS